MRVLLVQPVIKAMYEGEVPLFASKSHGALPPLGLISLATYLNWRTEHSAKVLDAAVLGLEGASLQSAVRKAHPDVVGLSPVTATLPDALETARLVKEADNGIRVVMGGSHATLFREMTARYEDVDAVVFGEGESAFPGLLNHFEGHAGPRKLRGAIRVDGGKSLIGPCPESVISLDSLPLPDRTLTPWKDYSSVFAERNPSTIMLSSKGCSFRCNFCAGQAAALPRMVRMRSGKLMAEEMASCAELGIKEVVFYDSLFTFGKRRIEEFCRELRERDLDVTWEIRTRPDLLDSDLLAQMKDVGLRTVRIGIESGTQEGLDSISKGFTLHQAEDGLRKIRRVGLTSVGYFMIGLPGETREMIEKTVELSIRIGVDYASYSVLVPYPGTPLWDQRLAAGDASLQRAWDSYLEHPSPAFDPPTCNGLYDKGELRQILYDAYKQFYLRSGFLAKEAARVHSWKGTLLKMRRTLRLLGLLFDQNTRPILR